jgi:hypothetical protein
MLGRRARSPGVDFGVYAWVQGSEPRVPFGVYVEPGEDPASDAWAQGLVPQGEGETVRSPPPPRLASSASGSRLRGAGGTSSPACGRFRYEDRNP